MARLRVAAIVAVGLSALALNFSDGERRLRALGMYILLTNLVGILLPGSWISKTDSCHNLANLLSSIPEHDRGAWQVTAARFGGFSIAARAMRNNLHDPVLCEKCAWLFCAMANFNRETSRIAGESDGPRVLVEAMRRHPHHAGLQAQGSASMGCWCDWTPETEEKVAALGGPQAVLSALRNFPDNVRVQFLGWAGLSSQSNRLDSKRIIIEAGAITTGMQLMRDPRLRKGFRVRQEILMTFANLVTNCNECANELMGAGDVIKQTIEAMEEEVPDAERGTKTDGIQLMMELARNNHTSRAAILEAGFVTHTLEAMKRFPKPHPQGASVWPLCEFAFELLFFLADGNKEAQAAMVRAGVPEVAQMAVAAAPGDGHRVYLQSRLLKALQGQ